MKSRAHRKSLFLTRMQDFVAVFYAVGTITLLSLPSAIFLFFRSSVFAQRLPTFFGGTAEKNSPISRFKNTSVENFVGIN